MEQEFWRRQDKGKPLFPDVVWSRPENKQYAGKLLIIGGNLHGFSAPAQAYNESLKAGVGTARVILPNSLEKTVSKIFPEAEYAPNTPSGSFSTKALGEILPTANWADGVLLAGDIGKNSETTILFDSLLEKYQGNVTLCGDMLDYAYLQPSKIYNRQNTLLVCDFTEFQKFTTHAKFDTAITSNMGIIKFVETLHEISKIWATNILVIRDGTAFVAANGQVSSTETSKNPTILAANASVWWLQTPQKPYEAITTSLANLA